MAGLVREADLPQPSHVLARRHLTVVNRTEPLGSSQYVLEDPGISGPSEVVAGDRLRTKVIEALRTVYDPEIPLNIYDLGLVYGLSVDERGAVGLRMTLTSPGCPVAGVLLRQAHERVRRVPGVSSVRTELVWDPPWGRDRMSAEARLALGLL